MAQNDGEGVLRRMVKLVSAPARDLVGLGTESRLSQFADAEKAELKAMIERKRRNDFVRKRELNMLRRIRREGLSAEQAAALDATSRLDDSEVRPSQPGIVDRGVKAKIDAIEQQMVGPGVSAGTGQAPAARTPPVRRAPAPEAPPIELVTVPADLAMPSLDESTRPMMMLPETVTVTPAPSAAVARPAPDTPLPTLTEPVPAAHIAPQQPGTLRAAPALPSVEVTEAVHDHELDEAVIAFANADFSHAERALVQLVSPKGGRAGHEDTWLTLFDLYRATGQQQRFDTLAQDFFQRFQKSSPQWYSLPRLVAEAASGHQQRQGSGVAGDIGWVCPPRLDAEALSHLISQVLQLPQPWVLDWTALVAVETEAIHHLQATLRQWAAQSLEMRWLASDRLFAVLQDAAPVGVRDADPAYWLARLEALRLINRPDQFDEVAIDYCVTYEVSPPSWEPSRCVTRVSGSAANTRSANLSVIGDAITTIQGGGPDTQGVAITTLDLSGQLSGDITPVLAALDSKLGGAHVVRISCALLIRVDFIAAGDLLNWIIARQGEGRHIGFIDVHRLVALMFGAMGITEHAPVHLRGA